MELDIKKNLIKNKLQTGIDNYHMSFQLGGILTVTLTKSPTANCQLYSLGCAMHLFRYDNWSRIMATMHRFVLKRRVLLDVPRANVVKIKEFFAPTDIIMENDYLNSTYGTKMTLLILDTAKIAMLSQEMMLEEQAEAKRLAEEKRQKALDDEAKAKVKLESKVKRPVGRPKKVQTSMVAEEPMITITHNSSGVSNADLVDYMRTSRRRASRPMTPAEAIPVVTVSTHDELVAELSSMDLDDDDLDDIWEEDEDPYYREQEEQELEEAENRAFEARMDEEARIANSEPSSFDPF